MKKTICVMAVLMVAIMALVGCNNASGIATTPASTKPVTTTPAATQPVATTPAPTTPTTTPAPTEPTTEEVVDELAILSTTFGTAETEGGIYFIRDGKIYSLNSMMPAKSGVKYTSIQRAYTGPNVMFYSSHRCIHGYYSSLGAVPIPSLSKNEKIIVYYSELRDLELIPANIVGYSFFMYKLQNYVGFDEKSKSVLNIGGKYEFEVADEAGNVLDNYISSKEDGLYTVSWYEGTRYNEATVRANCIQYDCDSNKSYYISGDLTKKGYAEYGLSNVPPGLYQVKVKGMPKGEGFLIRVE